MSSNTSGYEGKFSPEQLTKTISQLEQRYLSHHNRIQWRMQHFHNLPEVDPTLPIPFDAGPKYQSDLPRRIHQDLSARVCENEATYSSEPINDTPSGRKPANAFARWYNDGIQLLEERMDTTLQGALADGQIIHCYGVLHWRKAEHVWPDIPELDYLEAKEGTEPPGDGYEAIYRDDDESEEGVGTLGAYKLDDQGQPVREKGVPVTRKLRGWRQTEASRKQAYAGSCAEAGFPWLVETPLADSVMFVRDRSLLPQPAIAVVRRVVSRLEYIDALDKDRYASLNEANKDIPVFGEEDAPIHPSGSFTPSAMKYPSEGNWFDNPITIYEFWTRDEYYEIANGVGYAWEITKAGPHPYDMCPFALAYAQFIVSPDPILRAEPALEGVFRLKPLVDLWMSHQLVMGQQTALPYYYWKNSGTGEAMLNEKGVAITMDQNTANSEVAPAGYELAKAPLDEIGQGFLESGRDLREQMKDAAPNTGQTEAGAGTKPWETRLKQQEASVYPSRMIGSQARALRTMARNIAHVHSKSEDDGGFGTTYVYALTKDGVPDKENVLQLSPEDVKSLKIDVDISTQSGAERITEEEHQRTLYESGLCTLEEFAEATHKEDPDKWVINLKATKLYEGTVEPVIAQGALMEAFGNFFTFGANGEMIDYQGHPVTPTQVLLSNGQQPSPKPQAPSPTPAGGQQPPQQMPGMSQMAAPGTIPIGAGVAGS